MKPTLFDDPDASCKYTPGQLMHFQERYDNGYDVFADDDYTNWLSANYPDALPEHLRKGGEDPLPVAASSKIRVQSDNSILKVHALMELRHTQRKIIWSGCIKTIQMPFDCGSNGVAEPSSRSMTTPEVPKSSTPKSVQPGTSSAISEFRTTPPVGKLHSASKRKASIKRSIFGARVHSPLQ